VAHCEVYAQRPNDCDLPVPAIETHQALFGRAPHLAAAAAAFFSAKNEAAAKAKGVKRVPRNRCAISGRYGTSAFSARACAQGFWLSDWECGRISVAKRRHGLRRCHYRGYVGMHRWVGFGVIADNLINIGRAMEKQAAH
jgi:transposase, IS5 family